MAVSDVAIANRALQLLGSTEIDDIDNTTNPRAVAMKTAYVPVRDYLLRQFPWRFAIRRVSIAALGSTDIVEGLNQYLLPNDYCRLLREDETSTYPIVEKDWQVESTTDGQLVLLTADASPLKLRYVAKVDEPALFDASFDEALAYSLALNTCKQVTGSNTLMTALKVGMDEAIALAKRTGAVEQPAKRPPEDSWITVAR